MSEAKSTVGKSGGLKELEQAFSRAAGATAQPPVNMHMVQNVLLIWLDFISKSATNRNSLRGFRDYDCRNS